MKRNKSRVQALHINWTKPFRTCNNNAAYFVDDFELLTTILSSLLWKRYNGPIKLYTDSIGYDYYDKLGLLNLWDSVDVDTLNRIPESIDPEIFWAAAKLFAIRNEKGPVVMMDTDLLVWKTLDELKKEKIVAFHRESLNIDCYIPYEFLKKREGYQIDSQFDWSVSPCNTALTYFNDDTFKNFYTETAIDFMTDNKERPMEMISQMVFAEQRLFSMCAEKLGLHPHTFLPFEYNGECDDFTHLWGAKGIARTDESFHKELCTSLVNAIHREFEEYIIPEQVEQLINVS